MGCLTHSYDVAGNLVLSDNGLPSTNANAVTLGYGYDGAGHLTSVSSTLDDATHPQVLFEATGYSAVGLTGADYALPGGSGTAAFSQALTYGKRLRLTGETDTATTSTTNLPYSYAVGYDGVGNLVPTKSLNGAVMTERDPISSATKRESQPEPWLRGTLIELPAEQRAVLHALQLAHEDIRRWCASLTEEELSARPHGLPPVAFHIRHIVGSLDRLLTYAEGKTLSDEQKRQMASEMEGSTHRDELLALFEKGLADSEARIRAIDMELWPKPRGVGRKQLPTTVAGLLIHCAEHTQRHVGQAVTTAKVLFAQRETALD